MKQRRTKQVGDVVFFLIMGGLSGCFIVLIVLLLLADLLFTSPQAFVSALQKPEIQAAFRLSLMSCTVAAILSLWVATPLGYLLSRYSFPGRQIIDTIVDIPIVLPPLVLGLSLLILFHQPFPFTAGWGSESEAQTALAESTISAQVSQGSAMDGPETDTAPTPAPQRRSGWILDEWLRSESIGFQVSYRWPAVVLAQFAVSCAFAVRTMRITFDQINPRAEDVARTLGCSRGQAFLKIALPQAWRGMITATTIAWARALGEFGPILVFAGSTRFKTEVLSTTVFLELSVGQLDAAVAVSLLMVAMAIVVLLILRAVGAGLAA